MIWPLRKSRAPEGPHPDSSIIFIIGCGRSGTHWLGYILDAHPDIVATIEKRSIFRKVTAMALDQGLKDRYFSALVKRYRREHTRVVPRHYVDKSHPNLWLVEDLAEAFPNARFLGIQRNPFATVASMLRHPGVLNWCKIWKKFPVPNPFLGITESNVQAYENLSLAGRCALRWRCHARRMSQLEEKMGTNMRVVQYEDLIQHTSREVSRLQEHLKLSTAIPLPPVKHESLDKWRTNLTAEQRDDVERIVTPEVDPLS